MHAGPGVADGGVPVLDHLDPDRGPTEAGLDDVRALDLGGGAGALPVERPPGKRRQAGPGDGAAEGQLVHSERRTRSSRPCVGQAGEVEGSLQRSVLARAAMTAVDHRGELEGPFLAPQTALGCRRSLRLGKRRDGAPGPPWERRRGSLLPPSRDRRRRTPPSSSSRWPRPGGRLESAPGPPAGRSARSHHARAMVPRRRPPARSSGHSSSGCRLVHGKWSGRSFS